MDNNLHPDYSSVGDEMMMIPASIKFDDHYKIFLEIFLNRLLYGMNWQDRYG